MLFSLINELSGLALTLGQPTTQQPFKNQREQCLDLRSTKTAEEISCHVGALEFVAADMKCNEKELILRVSECSAWLLETVAPGFVVVKSFQEPEHEKRVIPK